MQQLYKRTVTLSTQECMLPSPLALFSSPAWEVPSLMLAKEELNATKDKLDNLNIGCVAGSCTLIYWLHAAAHLASWAVYSNVQAECNDGS